MSLKAVGVVEIPDSAGTLFDHGAFDPKSRRVFLAHTARDRVEVIDRDTRRHLATLPGFPEAAGVVADGGQVFVTNRGAASLAWVNAATLETRAVFDTRPRPNGVAVSSSLRLAAVACIGDDVHGPELQIFDFDGSGPRRSIELPGRPRWCVMNQEGTRVFLAIPERGGALGSCVGGRTRDRYRSSSETPLRRLRWRRALGTRCPHWTGAPPVAACRSSGRDVLQSGERPRTRGNQGSRTCPIG